MTATALDPRRHAAEHANCWTDGICEPLRREVRELEPGGKSACLKPRCGKYAARTADAIELRRFGDHAVLAVVAAAPTKHASYATANPYQGFDRRHRHERG